MNSALQPVAAPRFGLVVIGDEILSGKRQDKHFAKVIELLSARGLRLAWAHFVGDERAAITDVLTQIFASNDVVTGGIGATPDDHTRQAAAAALGVRAVLHPQAKELIEQRMRELAAEQGLPLEPDRPDNVHRLNMGVFPEVARIIPNPYNRIPGFSCVGPGGGTVHFVPGFPVMAWPMIEWVLDTYYRAYFGLGAAYQERSVIVFDGIEATLTPLMQRIEAEYPGVKVFSLPSVDHPKWGRHIELGVKGEASLVAAAYDAMMTALRTMPVRLGPEWTR